MIHTLNLWAIYCGYSVLWDHTGFTTVKHLQEQSGFFTLGLLLIGWIIDFFLIPSMDDQSDLKYRGGDFDYTIAWILLTFLGLLGIHRFYMRKWATGIIYLVSGGLFGIGCLYDLWTLNGSDLLPKQERIRCRIDEKLYA